jgi:hypothetical protein
MAVPAQVAQKTHDALCSAKTMDSAQLMGLLACSLRTLQRCLRKWGCLTSFNCNGQYYVSQTIILNQKAIENL